MEKVKKNNMPVLSNDIGDKLMEIFGLKDVVDLSIYFSTDKEVVVIAEFLPSAEEVRGLINLLKKYELHEIKEK